MSSRRTDGWYLVPRRVHAFAAEVGRAGLLVYDCLCSHADRNGVCWPSVRLIAREGILAPKPGRSARARLEAAGLVEITRRHRTSHRFRLPDVAQQVGESATHLSLRVREPAPHGEGVRAPRVGESATTNDPN